MWVKPGEDEYVKCMLDHDPLVAICEWHEFYTRIQHGLAVAYADKHQALSMNNGSEDAPKDSHSHTSLTSFHMLTPLNHASLHRCSGDNLKSVHKTAPGFGTSSWPRNLASAWTSPMVSLDVAVMKGFSYTALGS